MAGMLYIMEQVRIACLLVYLTSQNKVLDLVNSVGDESSSTESLDEVY